MQLRAIPAEIFKKVIPLGPFLAVATTTTTTKGAHCPDRNITYYVTSDDERALVEITSDVETERDGVILSFACLNLSAHVT